eukprot:jgi/Mesvir1/7761/Mv11704-RA.1
MAGLTTCTSVRINAKSGQDFTITAESDKLVFRRWDPATYEEQDVMSISSAGHAVVPSIETSYVEPAGANDWNAWAPVTTSPSVYNLQASFSKYKQSGKHVTLGYTLQWYTGPSAVWEFDNNATDTGAFGYNATPDTYATNSGDASKPYSPSVFIRGTHALNVSNSDEGVKIRTPSTNAGLYTILNGDLTLSLWFMTTDNTLQNQAIIGTSAESAFAFDLRYNGAGDGMLKFVHSGNVATYRGAVWTPTNNKWYHIVVTRSGNNVAMYVDNGATMNLAASSAGTKVAISSSATVMIGRKFGSATDYVRGYIDDVAIYDRVLSSNEIAELYTQSASSVSVSSTFDVRGLPTGAAVTDVPFTAVQPFQKTGGSNNYHEYIDDVRDANSMAAGVHSNAKSVVVGTMNGTATVVRDGTGSLLRFTVPKFIPGTWTVSGKIEYDVD